MGSLTTSPLGDPAGEVTRDRLDVVDHHGFLVRRGPHPRGQRLEPHQRVRVHGLSVGTGEVDQRVRLGEGEDTSGRLDELGFHVVLGG
jgi:hypothetical protein